MNRKERGARSATLSSFARQPERAKNERKNGIDRCPFCDIELSYQAQYVKNYAILNCL
jgi:hypothetical protein